MQVLIDFLGSGSWYDTINGAFELVGGWFTWNSALRLYRDKEVKGVYWPMFIFFASWGVWNLVFYWQVTAPLSWLGGIVLVAGNLWWTSLYAKYRWIDGRWS